MNQYHTVGKRSVLRVILKVWLADVLAVRENYKTFTVVFEMIDSPREKWIWEDLEKSEWEKILWFCTPEQMDGKDNKKMNMKGRTKKCKKKKRAKLIKGDEDRTNRILRNLQHPEYEKVPVSTVVIFTLLEKHSWNQVREGCRLPQKPLELKQTFPLFYILDLDPTRRLKNPFHLIKICTSINWRQKSMYPPFPLMSCCFSSSPSLFNIFYEFSVGLLKD